MAVPPESAGPPPPAELLEPTAEIAERPRPAAPQRDGAVDGVIDAGVRLATPLARIGWRTASGISRRLGLDRAVSRAAERTLERALDTDAAERATERVLGSDATKRVWAKVLESEEAQLLVERVAEAPEVRSAITSQGVGLLEDVRRSIRKAARGADGTVERAVRRILRRPVRTGRPAEAGAVTRGLAIAIDAAVLTGILSLISTVLALLISSVFSLEGNAAAATIAFGAVVWAIAAALYLAVFWTFAERTPGMTFLGLRIMAEAGGRVPPSQDIRRLIGFTLALLPAGLGFIGILLEPRRRGWHDRYAQTVVLYADPELDPGVDRSGHVTFSSAPGSR
jgi:uncharacterized RDD family membrane protein YckC